MSKQFKRIAQNKHDQQLLNDGWQFSGVGLFKHPQLPNKHFTKDQALNKHMGYFCPACTACGISDCCSPHTCVCLYGEEYKTEYKTMKEQWKTMHTFINQFVSPYAFIDRHMLADETKHLLEKLDE